MCVIPGCLHILLHFMHLFASHASLPILSLYIYGYPLEVVQIPGIHHMSRYNAGALSVLVNFSTVPSFDDLTFLVVFTSTVCILLIVLDLALFIALDSFL